MTEQPEALRLAEQCDFEQLRTVKLDVMHYNIAAELRRLHAKNEGLKAQLPEGMKHCTIVFKECEVGHGWLTATNWVQHGCLKCENEALRKDAERYARLWQLADDGDLYLCKCEIIDTFGNVKEVQFNDKAEMDTYLDKALAAMSGEKE